MIRKKIKRLIGKFPFLRHYSDLNVEYWDKMAKEDPYSAICTGFSEKEFDEYDSTIIFHSCIKEKLNKNVVVMDLCCGLGRVAKFVAPLVKQYVGIDFSLTMIEKAKQRNKLFNASFLKNDGYTLRDIPNSCIDIVFCELGFQHMKKKDARSYIKEVHRVLSYNGIFISQIPKLDFYGDIFFSYVKEEIDEMFSLYGTIEYIPYGKAYYLVRVVK